MKRLLVIAAFIALMAPALTWAGEADHALFYSANQAYKEGKFQDAAAQYEEMIAKSPVGGGVYFNLGNAFLKMDRIGLAILNYEKARILTPRDPDLHFNLGFAQDKRLDQIEQENAFFMSDLVRRFTGMEIFWIVAVLNLFLCFFYIVRLFKPAEWNFYVVMAVGLIWLTAVFFGIAKWYDASQDHRAVVIADKIDVRAGPGENDTLLFQLHDGSPVVLERREGDWSLVRFSQEKRGWTPNKGIAAIRPLRNEPAGRNTEA
ncbi:hypothetical protein Dalk_3468 [Desulfatibacillum aliphaticivorans]|uniref:Uncharacterized protein n=1 Tax=Desulfatibacillum aliphaticivorans TaxID=218208 RepID=B8FBV1_DESAL|nr:tetratricopeptide repeat protein [Desulfatibacillum aliphaticivorans]ACL05156.1 hypothetical protein Dalk_3468 [Desulfatibacillum aliphaticivorans]